jgi:hypothetical protein
VSEFASQASSQAVPEPVRFGVAVLTVFVSRAVGGAVVALLWAMVPVAGPPAAYTGWNRYVAGYSAAACVVAAFLLPVLLRMFRCEISYGAALVALFAGVVAANFVFGLLVSSSAPSPYWTLPLSSTFGPIGSIVSLLTSAWIVMLFASRRSSRRA